MILFALLAALIGTAQAAAPITTTTLGKVQGASLGEVDVFKGIPFAAPPVGDLRWMPPVAPAKWMGVRKATEWASECVQDNSPHVSGSEDCLYLNVWRPRVRTENLPVIVFIHGGSHLRGSPQQTMNGQEIYDGAKLAKNGNVIVVSIAYRLGSIGFLSHPKLSARSGYNGSGNYGYMDQIQALRWLKENVASFGGDPRKITVVGQSAGAWGVTMLLTSPLASGLFDRAVLHSGGTMAKPLAEAEEIGQQLSQKAGCDKAEDEIACLKSKTPEELIHAMPGDAGSGSSHFTMVVDGYVLPEFPLRRMQSGLINRVPVLIGVAEEEASYLANDVSEKITNEEEYRAAIRQQAGDAVDYVLGVYPLSNYESPRLAYNAIAADFVFVCPSRRISRALAFGNIDFVGKFYFTQKIASGPLARWGAAHAFDLFYLFGNFKATATEPTSEDLALSEKFQKQWARFADVGVPNADGYDMWIRHEPMNDTYYEMGRASGMKAWLRATECNFWDMITPL